MKKAHIKLLMKTLEQCQGYDINETQSRVEYFEVYGSRPPIILTDQTLEKERKEKKTGMSIYE
jgi:hypothetical protein